MRIAKRRQQKYGSIASNPWEIQAAVQKLELNPKTMPGIDRIELICNERFGSEITPGAVRRLRAEVCRTASMKIDSADDLSLIETANILGAESGTEATKPRRRGRKKAGHQAVQQEAQVAAEWEQARNERTSKADFAKDREYSLKEFNRLLDRVRKRKALRNN